MNPAQAPLKIAPSILSADFTRLGEEFAWLDRSDADLIHIDVMDGHFVPNLTFGPPVIASLRKTTAKVFDVHLMVANPEPYLAVWKDAGADVLGIHREIRADHRSLLRRIRALGMRASLTWNPDTPVDDAAEFLEDVDQILLMSVFPGFGGQKFIEETLERGARVAAMIRASGRPVDLEIDGGVNQNNISRIRDAGFNVIVAGSSVFGAADRDDAIRLLKTPKP